MIDPLHALARRLTEMADDLGEELYRDQQLGAWPPKIQQFAEAVAAIVAQETREQDAPYMQHTDDCEWRLPERVAVSIGNWSKLKCTCGLEAIRAGAAPAKEQEET